MTENKTGTGITLCELKERIYKTLGEYSANGVEITDADFDKADMEKRIITCINTAVTKAVQHLPVYTLSSLLYFPEIKTLFKKENIKLSKGETLVIPADSTRTKTALVMKACGSFTLSKNETILHEITNQQSTKISKHAFVIDTSDCYSVILTASEDNCYIDVIYTAQGTLFEKIPSAELFPDDGMTFAVSDNLIHQITYAEHEGKSIPVYNYESDENYIYTSVENAGKTELHYTPKPCVFTEQSAEDELLLLPEITVCAVVYLAASELCLQSDTAAYNLLSHKYRDIALNCYDRQKTYSRNSFYGAPCKKLVGKEG